MERLNKYLAHAGLGSRRHCEELIVGGHVAVDDVVVRELGTKVDPATNKVSVDGQPLTTERPVYWLLNKPRGYLCTNDDPGGRPRAIDLVDHIRQRVYTVGRLDEDSEGLLLLTNDGDLAHKLMHPRFGIDKTYSVQVAGIPTREQLDKLLEGVWMSDGHVKPKSVKRVKQQGESTWLEIVLSEGRNREIRRMLAGLGHKVMRLKRIGLGTIHLGRLARGKSRPLSPPELIALQYSVRGATSEDVAEQAANETTIDPSPDRPRFTDFANGEGKPKGEREDRPRRPDIRSGRPPANRRGPGRPDDERPADRRGPGRREDETRGERPEERQRNSRPFTGAPRPEGAPNSRKPAGRPSSGRPGPGRPAPGRDRAQQGGDRRPANGPGNDRRPRGPGRPPADRRGPVRPDGERPAFQDNERRPTGRGDDHFDAAPRGRRPGGQGRRPEGDENGPFQGEGGGERRPYRQADGPPPRDRRPAGPGRPAGERRGPGRPDGDRREQRGGSGRPAGGPGRPGRGPTGGPGRPARSRPIVPKTRQRRKPS